jgi:glutaredoxin
MIVVYTQEGCGNCELLKSRLREKNIEFTECSDIEIMAEKLIRSIPVMEVDGKSYNYYNAINIVKGM